MKLKYFKLLKKSLVVKSLQQLSSAISCQRLGKLAGSAFFIFTTVSSQGLLLLYTPNSSKVAAQTVTPALCANPGRDGSTTPTGTVNTYYPGTATANAGATSISIGSINTAGATTPIAAGDLLLVIQVQDAAINSNNTTAYGANNASGSGSTNINSSGLYEYVVATGAVSGGSVQIKGTGTSGGLLNTYTNANATTTQGQRRFQVVRVPQYSSVTSLSNVTAAAWNGATGGIVAVDVAGSVGGGSINVTGKGFRGGGGRQLQGGTVGSTAPTNSDYLYPTSTSGTTGAHGAKGEGIAGTPRYLFDSANTSLVNTGVEGYPNGSNAQGAPGNAGGGGTDGRPSANDQNTGGGGGSNAGAGGKGGNAWSSSATVGGIGGAAFTGAANRLILGGGGGAGGTNDATGTPANGLASSGAAGGGIVMLRAGTLSSVTITADGANALNTVLNDGSGGGGAGGSVLVSATNPSSITVSAKGGTGGTNTGGGTPHGPGGGGGGGFVARSSTVTASATVTGGANGTTAGTPSNFGATSGANGQSTTISTTPGAGSGAECLPVVAGYKSVKLTTDADANNALTPGDTLTWTFSYANTGPSDVSNFQITDTLPTGVTSAGTPTISTNTTQGTTPAVNTNYNGSNNTNLLSSTTTLKVGGVITVNIPVKVNSSVIGTLSNQATGSGTNLATAGIKTDNIDNTTTNLPAGVTVPTGSIAQTQTANIDPTTATVVGFNVSGTLYKDNNTNSTFDSGDTTLPANITVILYNDANNNNQIDSGEQVGSPANTDANGNYTFASVVNGTYKIKVNTANTNIPSGNVLETSNDLSVIVNGADITSQNFGFVPLPTSFGSCSASPYISYNSPNTLGALNISTLSLDTVGNSTFPYNAIGYNIVDNLIYGIRRTTATATPYSNSNELVVIGSNGKPINLGVINGLPLLTTNSLYNSGDVASNGIYYVVNGLVADKKFYKIDINPASPTYKQVLSSFSLPALYNTTGYSFGDIAFNPVDGQLYAVLNTVNTSNAITAQQLAKIDPSSGSVTPLGTPTLLDLDSFIGLFVDNTGSIYGYQGTAGKLWRYNSTTGIRVLVKDGLPTASNNADGARCYNSPPISALSERPQVLLVKRITAVDSTTYTTFRDDPNDQNDNNANWPSSFLKGEYIAPDKPKPGSVVEYTIYFLSTGGSDASNASLCDLVPANTTFLPDAFATGKGIKSSLGTTTTDLTNASDTDKGRFYASTETAPTGCRVSQTVTNGNGTTTLTNAKGAVVVDLGTVSRATAPGTANSYGFIKFQVKVD